MKPGWIIGLGVISVVFMVVLLAMMGFISIPGLNFGGLGIDDPEAPPNAEYCGYTDMQILDMIELGTGKSLNNQVGLGFVDSLNMVACGADNTTMSTVITYYKNLWQDWYIQYDNIYNSGNFDAQMVTWSSNSDATNSSFAKAVLVGEGNYVKEVYNYDTITIRSEGTMVTYAAFFLWIANS